MKSILTAAAAALATATATAGSIQSINYQSLADVSLNVPTVAPLLGTHTVPGSGFGAFNIAAQQLFNEAHIPAGLLSPSGGLNSIALSNLSGSAFPTGLNAHVEAAGSIFSDELNVTANVLGRTTIAGTFLVEAGDQYFIDFTTLVAINALATYEIAHSGGGTVAAGGLAPGISGVLAPGLYDYLFTIEAATDVVNDKSVGASFKFAGINGDLTFHVERVPDTAPTALLAFLPLGLLLLRRRH